MNKISDAGRSLAVVAVIGNVMGVALLSGVPSPYRPSNIPGWLAGSRLNPIATVASSWAFVIGLATLAVFVLLLAMAAAPHARRPAWVWAGAGLIAAGALLNAAGCFGPAVAVRFLDADAAGEAAGRALLAISLHLDAHFNLTLGVGLLLINLAGRPRWPRWLRGLGSVAGLASLPVALQSWSDDYARLLALAGPLWLLWLLLAAWRGFTVEPSLHHQA